MTLATAVAALDRGDHGAARDALVAAWRKRRAPAIAELVDVLELHAPDAFTTTLAAIVTPRAVSSLANLAALDDTDDPRLATWALHALADPPFCSPKSGPFLEHLAATITRLRDPRLDAQLPVIVRILTARVTRKPIYTSVIAHLERGIAARKKLAAAVPAERALEAELAAKIAPLRGAMVTHESLLAEVYARPNDDAPRMVLADFLLERGDPYGELITLQLARGREGEPSPREQELLKLHGKAWLGPLAPVLRFDKVYSRTAFVRGFVAVADFIFKIDKKLPLVLHDEAWSTVERLERCYEERTLLVHAPLRSLREITVDPILADALAQRTMPFASVTRIEITRNLEVVPVALLERLFPAREVLALAHLPDLTRLDRFGVRTIEIDQACAEATRVDRMAGHRAFIAALETAPLLVDRISIREPWSEYPRPAPVSYVRGTRGYIKAYAATRAIEASFAARPSR